MKKVLLIAIATLAVFLIVSYFFVRKNKSVSSDDLNAKLENWSLYQEIIDPEEKWVGSGDCSADPINSPNDFDNFKALAKKGSMKELILPGNFGLTLTPNYFSWSNEKFLSFTHNENAICAVAGRYPLRAYPDKLLWVSVCSTGFMPSEDSPMYNDFMKCIESEQIVRDYFKFR